MAKKKDLINVQPEDVRQQINDPTGFDELLNSALTNIPPVEMMEPPVEQQEEPQGQMASRGPASEQVGDALFADPAEVARSFLKANPRPNEMLGNQFNGNTQIKDQAAKIKTAMESIGFFDNLRERAAISLGRDDKEDFNILQNMHGKENVRIKNGVIEFRPDKETPFSPVRGEEFTFNPVDYAGDIIEMAIGIGSEMALFASTGGMGTAARLGVRAAGIGTIGGAGSLARGVIADMAGADDGDLESDIKEFDRATMAGLLNLAGAGFGEIVKGSWKYVKALKNSTPKRVALRASDIVEETERVMRTTGPLPDPDSVLAETYTGVKASKEKFFEELQFWKAGVRTAVGDNPVFRADNYMEVAQKEFADMGVVVNNKTMLAEVTPDTLFPPGPAGERHLRDAVEQYNDIVFRMSRDGGINFGMIDNLTSDMSSRSRIFYEGSANIDKNPASGRLMTVFGQALKNDQIGGMTSAINQLAGTADDNLQKSIQSSVTNYARAMGSFENFRRLYRESDESGTRFINSLVKKDNVKPLTEVKYLIGAESEDWKRLHSLFVDSKMRQATDPNTGIMSTRKFFESISDEKIGKEVRRQFLKDGDYNRLRVLAREYDKVDLPRIIGEGGAGIGDAMFALSPIASPYFKAKLLWSMFSKNGKLVDEIYEQGFREWAKQARRKTGKNSSAIEMIQAREHFGNILFNSYKNKNGEYVQTPIIRKMFVQTSIDGTESTRGTIFDVEEASDEIEMQDQQRMQMMQQQQQLEGEM